MDPVRINEMVDRKILTAFGEGTSIGAVQSDLKVRIKNFTNTITKDGLDIDSLWNKKYDDIEQIRHRYGITYIKQCHKRIEDLTWILSNRHKFSHLNNTKLFKLIKFKEKLESNVLPF